MSEFLGEALLEIVQRAFSEINPAAKRVWLWMRENAEPPTPMRLSTEDGMKYSGIAVVDHNKVIAIIAVQLGTEPSKQGQPPQGQRPPDQRYQRELATPPEDEEPEPYQERRNRFDVWDWPNR